jgi:hypothetical protein
LNTVCAAVKSERQLPIKKIKPNTKLETLCIENVTKLPKKVARLPKLALRLNWEYKLFVIEVIAAIAWVCTELVQAPKPLKSRYSRSKIKLWDCRGISELSSCDRNSVLALVVTDASRHAKRVSSVFK